MEESVSGLVYHLKSIKWTHFGTLTLRILPPRYILHKCINEYLNRIIKRFCVGNNFNWSTSWIVRFEYGEKTGRLHVHFLFTSDKPHSNPFTQCAIMEHIWSVDTASRWVNRLNEEQKKHNRKLRSKYHFKSDAQFERDHFDELRISARNDFSAPGHADVRVYDPNLKGEEYLMKDEDIALNGANRYEIAKFNNVSREDVTLMASHRLLFDLFNKSGATGTGARARFLKSLEERNTKSGIRPRSSDIEEPNLPKQLWDPNPVFPTESWSMADSSY